MALWIVLVRWEVDGGSCLGECEVVGAVICSCESLFHRDGRCRFKYSSTRGKRESSGVCTAVGLLVVCRYRTYSAVGHTDLGYLNAWTYRTHRVNFKIDLGALDVLLARRIHLAPPSTK